MSIWRTMALALLFLTASQAAWSFDPEPGMWSIDGELNGKPGRGFQIDTQSGQLLILSYFGYRADGSSMFLQASGPKQITNVFEADLYEFAGGTALGGAQQSGRVAAPLGKVTVVFDSPTSGSITLPGEPTKRISRFQFEDNTRRFNNRFDVNLSYDGWAAQTQGSATMTAKDGNFKMTLAIYTRSVPSALEKNCALVGSYVLAGKGLTSSGSMDCVLAQTGGSSHDTYRTEELAVDAYGSLTGRLYLKSPNPINRDTRIFMSGVCVTSGAIFNFTPRCAVDELGLPSAPGPAPDPRW